MTLLAYSLLAVAIGAPLGYALAWMLDEAGRAFDGLPWEWLA